MSLQEKVSISSRFLRSTRIDIDNADAAIEGFVFPDSLKELLVSMGKQHHEGKQGAFTWTGPYGSGKSSLALVLSQLIGRDKDDRKKIAEDIKDKTFTSAIEKLYTPGKSGWRFVNIIGSSEKTHLSLAKGLKTEGFKTRQKLESEESVIQFINKIASSDKETSGGLVIIIDEMGKFLEGSASGANDIYFLQLLAEQASRSNGRLLVIGILHQAFQEYASKLGRTIRDEWSKIQGRFADIPVNISGEEQIHLLSKAIVTSSAPKFAVTLGKNTEAELNKSAKPFGKNIGKYLSSVWPLHPISAIVLGPISKRSYGQNQRSLFTFLSASEKFGFQDFLKNSNTEDDVFSPADLWDYLMQNLQSSIAVSGDSHHFSIAQEAIDRCISENGNDNEIRTIKTIAVLELTSQQTGLSASLKTLELCLYDLSSQLVQKTVSELEKKSLILFRKYKGSYGLYEGSDFDIELALEQASREISHIDLTAISNALGITMISAKRHYHQTGTMRWCDFFISPVSELKSINTKRTSQAFGVASLVLPTNDESAIETDKLIQQAQKAANDFDLLIATSERTHKLVSLAKEHTLLSHIKQNRREVDRDKVARREIKDRLEAVTNMISQEIWSVLATAKWTSKNTKSTNLTWPQVNGLVSDLASQRFHKAPIIHNELINRREPSGSANGALKLLLHAMVLRENEEQLDFDKFPAEKGLYCSIIEANGLHVKGTKGWSFLSPLSIPSNTLSPLWKETSDFLSNNANRSVSLKEVFDLWRSEPFGVCDGIMPLLSVLYILTEKASLAFYRDGVFLSQFTDIDVDYLMKAPNTVELRWMDMSDLSRQLLSNLAVIASKTSGRPVLNLQPLDVARALISAYESSATWVQRTSRLSQNALKIRSLFKRSHDPNQFLFDDIPALYSSDVDITTEEGVNYISKHIEDGLDELLGRYPEMLQNLRDQLLHELQVPSTSPQAIRELNERAENVKGITGNMRLEAFINHLITFDNSDTAVEKLVGLAINKPAKIWVDSDIDKATISIAEFAQQFNKSEAFARVDGRKDKREAMAVVVGMDGRPVPVIQEFDVLESEQEKVASLAADLQKTLNRYDNAPQNILLAALATVSANVIGSASNKEEDEVQHAD